MFPKVNQTGGNNFSTNTSWGVEIDLDIEMVSAICPKCNILLVEATSNSFSDLGTAVNEAVALGAVAVSNSYGGGEWSGETGADDTPTTTTPAWRSPRAAVTEGTASSTPPPRRTSWRWAGPH